MAKYATRFFIEHGTRNVNQMVQLRKNDLDTFEIPLASTIHFTTRNTSDIGIEPDDPILQHAGKRILLDFVADYQGEVRGPAVRRSRIIEREARSYVSKSKSFLYYKLAKGMVSVQMVPFIINYSGLDLSYRYRQGVGTEFFRMFNYFNTVFENVKKQLAETDRHQMVLLDIPSTLLPVSRLNELENAWVENKDKDLPLDLRLLKYINSDGLFILFQMWLWAGENTQESILSKFTEQERARVDLLFFTGENYTILNLGRIEGWIKRETSDKGTIMPAKIQRIVLRMFMAFQQHSSLMEDKEIVDEETAESLKDVDPSTIDPKLAKAVENTQDIIKNGSDDPKLEVNVDARGMKGNLNVKAKTGKSVTTIVKDTPSQDEDDYDINKGIDELLGGELDKDLDQLETVAAQADVIGISESPVYKKYQAREINHTSVIDEMADKLAAEGNLTAAEVRRAKGLARRHEQIKSGYEDDKTIAEYAKIDPEDLKITESKLMDEVPKGVLDKSMINYSLKSFDADYIEKILGKDIVNAVLHVQKAGIALTDFKIEEKENILGSYYTFSCQLTPIVGSPTTIKFDLPKVSEDGIMLANGVKYKMRKQRADAPIRKVSANSVALTSYISKMFVDRTGRAAYNHERWLIREINKISLGNDARIKDIAKADVFFSDLVLPRSYTEISRHISNFKFDGVPFFFDYRNIDNNFPADLLPKINREKYTPVAFSRNEDTDIIIALTQEDRLVSLQPATRKVTQLGTLAQFFGFDLAKEATDYAEVGILGKAVPVGILLSYQIGFGNLLETSGCKYRVIKRGVRGGFDETKEFLVRFEDETIVFDKTDYKAALLFNGFNRVKNVIRTVSRYQLDKQDIFVRLLNALDVQNRHTKYYTLMFNTWVDHITHDLLVEMDEPTDLVLLFLSAIDKLVDDQHQDQNSVEGSIIRGYQRLSGMVYEELFKSVRQYTSAPASKNSRVEMNPRAVWFAVIQDETVSPIEESNPFHAIKEKEVLVFRGRGGRSAQSMTAKHRQFTKSDIGIISEANVDNGSVGTVTYLTADPNITNLRGVVKPVDDLKNVPRTKVQSTSMLISAGSDMDDQMVCCKCEFASCALELLEGDLYEVCIGRTPKALNTTT